MINYLPLVTAIAFSILINPQLSIAATRSTNAVAYPVEIIRVIDGDTVVVSAPYLPLPLKPELGVRIFGIDTPETGWRAKCEFEKTHGTLATKHTIEFVTQQGHIQLLLIGWDKFGGRVLGDILIDGQLLSTSLLESGLAHKYNGGTKQSWC